MPHHKSAAKRIKTSETERQRNRVVRSQLRTLVKKASQTEEPQEARSLIPSVNSAFDKAVKKGVLKKTTAARQKSSLVKILMKKAGSDSRAE
jgi:small subunit ribosomal protein S20